MTATIRDPNGTSGRRRLRLASMENLGFYDVPGSTNAWSDTLTHPIGRHQRKADVPDSALESDPFADWVPTEIGTRLLKGNIRWSLIAGILLIAAGMVVLGYWLYQRPIEAAASAAAELNTAASAIHPHLAEMQDMAAVLLDPAEQAAPTGSLLAAESAARNLFDVSSALPSSEGVRRARAADVASDTLDAAGLLTGAFAFRSAVIPILIPPELETEPEFVQLDEAARQFGEWHAGFDRVRFALPTGLMSELASQLELFSSELDSLQTRYLDALRRDDAGGATVVLHEIRQSLESLTVTLFTELEDVAIRVEDRLTRADTALESLLG